MFLVLCLVVVLSTISRFIQSVVEESEFRDGTVDGAPRESYGKTYAEVRTTLLASWERGQMRWFKAAEVQQEPRDDSFLGKEEARALIALQLMQSGMDPSKEASWHAAAEDVVDLEMGDLGYELESQSEEIRMEDDETEYQASLEAQASEEAEAERFDLERRDETIRMDD
jgi:hypothetical protein